MRNIFLRTRIRTLKAENQFQNKHIEPHKKFRRSYLIKTRVKRQ